MFAARIAKNTFRVRVRVTSRTMLRPLGGVIDLSHLRADMVSVCERRSNRLHDPPLTRHHAVQRLGGPSLSAATLLSRAWADEWGPSLNFLVIGDWAREGTFGQRQAAMQMAKSNQELGAPFMICVGDNFYDDDFISAQDPAWKPLNVFKLVFRTGPRLFGARRYS